MAKETEYEKAKRVFEGDKKTVNTGVVLKLEDELKKYQEKNGWMKDDPGMKEKYDREIQSIQANIDRDMQILSGNLKSAMKSAQRLNNAILPYITGTEMNAKVNTSLNNEKIVEIDRKIEGLEIEIRDLESSIAATIEKNKKNEEERNKIDKEIFGLTKSTAYKDLNNPKHSDVINKIADLTEKRKSIKDIKNSTTEKIEAIKKEKSGLEGKKEELQSDNKMYENKEQLLNEYRENTELMKRYRTIAKNMGITLEEPTPTTPSSTPTTPSSTPTTPSSTPTTPSSTPTTPSSTPTTPASTPTTPASTPTTPASTPTTPSSTPTTPLPKKQSRIGKLWANIRSWVAKVTNRSNPKKKQKETPDPEQSKPTKKDKFKKEYEFDYEKAEADKIQQYTDAAKEINKELNEAKKKGKDELRAVKEKFARKTLRELQDEYHIDYSAATVLFSESSISKWRSDFREESIRSIYYIDIDKDTGKDKIVMNKDDEGHETTPKIRQEKIKELSEETTIEALQRKYFLTKAEATDIYNDKGVKEEREKTGKKERSDDEKEK